MIFQLNCWPDFRGKAYTSSRSSIKQRRIDELTEKLISSDTVIATELSRLGRSTSEVIDLINILLKSGIRVILIKQNLDM